MIDLVILGAGGTGLDVLDCVDAINAISPRYRCLGFLDDDARKQASSFGGLPVLGPLSSAPGWPQARFINALGGPGSFTRRPAATRGAGVPDERFETLAHPAASISSRARLGRGVLVYPHATIGPNVRVGSHVQILANVVVNHDAQIGDWTIIASGAAVSGRVRLGSCCYVGTGAVLKEDVVVGDGAMIGMGAVVIREVAASSTVIGNPAQARPPAPPGHP